MHEKNLIKMVSDLRIQITELIATINDTHVSETERQKLLKMVDSLDHTVTHLLKNKTSFARKRFVLHPKDLVLIVSANARIHDLWNQKLQTLSGLEPELKIIHFDSQLDLLDWGATHAYELLHTVLFIDESVLLNPGMGLEITRALGVTRFFLTYAHLSDILATQHIETHVLLHEHIPQIEFLIQVDQKIKMHVDVVILEDNIVFANILKMLLEAHQQVVHVYHEPENFLAHFSQYAIHTKMCIDYSLGSRRNGFEVCDILHAAGYRALYVCTGWDAHCFTQIPPYVTLIVKGNPESMVNNLLS